MRISSPGGIDSVAMQPKIASSLRTANVDPAARVEPEPERPEPKVAPASAALGGNVDLQM